MIMKNFKNIEFTSDPRERYIYDNCFNFIEWKHPNAPISHGGVFGDIGPYTYADLWYDIFLPMNDLLWNWVWGKNQDPNSGNIKNLIIDDYENNPSWKQNRYKALQIGNHTLEEVEIRCSISVILYFLAYIITLMVSQMKYQLLKMVVQWENLEHQPKHINLLQKMLVQWCMDNNNLLK